MSARVVKALDATSFSPFAFPSIGDTGDFARGQSAFVVPAFDPADLPVAAPQPILAEPTILTADEIIENARAEASRIVVEAEQARGIIEQAAIEKAQLEAQAALQTEVEARMADVRAELAASLESLANLSNEITGHVESDLVELALQIAKKVVRREVTIDREIALTLVRVSLSKLNQRTAAEVHLNPEDISYINSHLDSLNFRGALTLVEDASISLGGCLIHTETGDVDARIESQFDEISFGLLN